MCMLFVMYAWKYTNEIVRSFISEAIHTQTFSHTHSTAVGWCRSVSGEYTVRVKDADTAASQIHNVRIYRMEVIFMDWENGPVACTS